MEASKEVGKRVRYLRDQRGLSQKGLGDALEVRQSTISEIERGSNKPSIVMLLRIAKYFGVQPGYFVDNIAEEAASEKAPAIPY